MAKQKKLQQYVFKINSTLLRKNDWNLNLPLNRARNTTGLVVALADSQILSWINELNPIYCEAVPLSLEEIFISETEVAGYDIKSLIS